MNDFRQFDLSEASLKALEDLGIRQPTGIQKQSIESFLEGRDIIAKAPTGTGKTFAFALPILEHIDPKGPAIQSLILAPTRELAIQIADDFESLLLERPEYKVLLTYGGQSFKTQLRKLKDDPQILVATPGRLLDHLRRRNISLKNCKICVLDEADRMLDMGFIDDVKRILDQLPEERQIGLFSATLSRAVMDVSWLYQHRPVEFEVKAKEEDKPQIEAFHCEANGPQRVDAIIDFMKEHEVDKALVFVNMKQTAEIVASNLDDKGLPARHLHGDLNQRNRERILQQFRDDKIQILCATDVAARGLDIEAVDLVVNYDVPLENESYIHRIGRTGRAGKKGLALSFYTSATQKRFFELLRMTRQESELWDWQADDANFNWIPLDAIDEAALKEKFQKQNKQRRDGKRGGGRNRGKSGGRNRRRGSRGGKKQHNRGKSRDAKPTGDKASDDKKNKTIRHF